MNKFKYHATSIYQTFFSFPGSCQMEGIIGLYNYVMIYLVGILFFVTTALVFITYTHLDGARHIKQLKECTQKEFIEWLRYTRAWTHSTPLELVWTIIPTIILIAIAVPSFILLYALDEIVDTQCIVKTIGYQWYWKYEYPIELDKDLDVVNVCYFSYMIPTAELTETWDKRLLEVDIPLVLPHGCNVKLIVSAKDVIHSFAVPSLGIKMDGVPGRLNQVTVFIFKPGIYYGQCSELCGVNHAFMPIVVHAISYDLFNQFLYKILFVTTKTEMIDLYQNNWDQMLTFFKEKNTDEDNFDYEKFSRYIKLYNESKFNLLLLNFLNDDGLETCLKDPLNFVLKSADEIILTTVRLNQYLECMESQEAKFLEHFFNKKLVEGINKDPKFLNKELAKLFTFLEGVSFDKKK